MSHADYGKHDEALGILAPYDGLGNHGPMAAEALCALGRGELAADWCKRYVKRFKYLKKREKSYRTIDSADWRASLGKFERVEDWSAFFVQQLREQPWQEILDTWVKRLAPGFSAIALHGPIRAGHAVRALANEETPQRLQELADGLAHWAAGFRTLPNGDSGQEGGMPSLAIEKIKTVSVEERPPLNGFVTALEKLNDVPEFANVIHLIDIDVASDFLLDDMINTFASAGLHCDSDFMSVLAFVHMVTGPAALQMIAPHISQDTLTQTLPYAWQAAAGLYTMFGKNTSFDGSANQKYEGEELIDRAISTDDEHAIKFTEVCLRETRKEDDATFLAVASRAVNCLGKFRL